MSIRLAAVEALGPLPPGMRVLGEEESADLAVSRGSYVTAIVVWLEKDGYVHPVRIGWRTMRLARGGEIVRRLEREAGAFEEAIRLGTARRIEEARV